MSDKLKSRKKIQYKTSTNLVQNLGALINPWPLKKILSHDDPIALGTHNGTKYKHTKNLERWEIWACREIPGSIVHTVQLVTLRNSPIQVAHPATFVTLAADAICDSNFDTSVANWTSTPNAFLQRSSVTVGRSLFTRYWVSSSMASFSIVVISASSCIRTLLTIRTSSGRSNSRWRRMKSSRSTDDFLSWRKWWWKASGKKKLKQKGINIIMIKNDKGLQEKRKEKVWNKNKDKQITKPQKSQCKRGKRIKTTEKGREKHGKQERN